jgi:hypothetical protein
MYLFDLIGVSTNGNLLPPLTRQVLEHLYFQPADHYTILNEHVQLPLILGATPVDAIVAFFGVAISFAERGEAVENVRAQDAQGVVDFRGAGQNGGP